VALTLPSDVVRGLRRDNTDLAWAIVSLYEKERPRHDEPVAPPQDPALVAVGPGLSLIVMDPALVRGLRGVDTIPIGQNRAFLALEAGRGLADLELAIIDALEDPGLSRHDAASLRKLRETLRAWRADRTLKFETRAIIVVEQRQHKPAARRR
jgi:hypothetical protein